MPNVVGSHYYDTNAAPGRLFFMYWERRTMLEIVPKVENRCYCKGGGGFRDISDCGVGIR